ncbi:MAG: hypothetical protein JW730_21570 [Anaerolineales bacterium]|nr:hypothetical protein [Anaerolineales bacterium]
MFFEKKHEPEELVKKYFFFLVEQYGFTYTTYCFTSKKVKLTFEIGHKTPSIFIARLGEPDFTRLIFERVIQYFEGELPNIDFQAHPLEYNVRFMADILKGYASKITAQIDEWWIPVQLFQYKLMEKEYRESDQLDDFLYSFKQDYDYLKGKGAL